MQLLEGGAANLVCVCVCVGEEIVAETREGEGSDGVGCVLLPFLLSVLALQFSLWTSFWFKKQVKEFRSPVAVLEWEEYSTWILCRPLEGTMAKMELVNWFYLYCNGCFHRWCRAKYMFHALNHRFINLISISCFFYIFSVFEFTSLYVQCNTAAVLAIGIQYFKYSLLFKGFDF
jgi:hypothetical protein